MPRYQIVAKATGKAHIIRMDNRYETLCQRPIDTVWEHHPDRVAEVYAITPHRLCQHCARKYRDSGRSQGEVDR